jgi:hypothetical protein
LAIHISTYYHVINIENLFRKDLSIPELTPSAEEKSGREARFAWYYMTTTLTAVSTSTETSTTTAGLFTIQSFVVGSSRVRHRLRNMG